MRLGCTKRELSQAHLTPTPDRWGISASSTSKKDAK